MTFRLDQYPMDRQKLEVLCREYHVSRLAVFGSRLHAEERPGSDIDLLVEFEETNIPGLFDFIGLEQELTKLLGTTVDLNTPKFLNSAFRQSVLNDAVPIYTREGSF